MQINRVLVAEFVAALLLLGANSQAGAEAGPPSVAEMVPQPIAVQLRWTEAVPAAPSDRYVFAGQPLAAQTLARLRGGTDSVSNDMKLSGVVADNSAVNVTTGANLITNGSFSNAAGLPVAIQNSGANVLIQNATIINVQMQ